MARVSAHPHCQRCYGYYTIKSPRQVKYCLVKDICEKSLESCLLRSVQMEKGWEEAEVM